MFFYIIYKLAYYIANILPLSVAYWLSERLADIQHDFSKKDREAVIENLSIVLSKDREVCKETARKVFRNFGLYLVDFFRVNRLNKKIIEKRVTLIGGENMEEVLKQNRGVIALTCHIGSWEMGGVAMAIMGYNLSVVALNHNYKIINNFFIRQREEKGLKVISMSSVMRGCVRALKEGGVLALVGDRDFTNNGILLKFFGVPTSIPKGPAALSILTNSAVLPVFFIRVGRYNYNLIFDKPIEIEKEPSLSEDSTIEDATKKLVTIMEKYIRCYPDQWLMFRKFWEAPVDAFIL